MSRTTQAFAIAGAGFAGAKAAEALREEGFDGRLVLVGDEPTRSRRRPCAPLPTTAKSKPPSPPTPEPRTRSSPPPEAKAWTSRRSPRSSSAKAFCDSYAELLARIEETVGPLVTTP